MTSSESRSRIRSYVIIISGTRSIRSWPARTWTSQRPGPRADGSTEILLDVPRYDFNWRLWYKPAVAIRVEPGDRLRGRAWYDNSEGNPQNPDPSVRVRYGEQSFEEMMFGFFEFVPDPETERTSGL